MKPCSGALADTPRAATSLKTNGFDVTAHDVGNLAGSWIRNGMTADTEGTHVRFALAFAADAEQPAQLAPAQS